MIVFNELKESTLSILEETLVEQCHAPDFITTQKVQEDGLPDYNTYKQAIDKGITTYKQWLEKNKN